MTNNTTEDLLQGFKPNLTLLNAIIYSTATVIFPFASLISI